MTLIIYLLIIITLLRILNAIIHRYQLLITLLSFELITLSMVGLISFTLIEIEAVNPYIIIIILTIGACEARLGLTVIVLISRKFGNDRIKIVSLSKC